MEPHKNTREEAEHKKYEEAKIIQMLLQSRKTLVKEKKLTVQMGMFSKVYFISFGLSSYTFTDT